MQSSSLNKRDHHKDAGERSKILKGIFVHRTFTLANRKTEVEDYCPKHFSICIYLFLCLPDCLAGEGRRLLRFSCSIQLMAAVPTLTKHRLCNTECYCCSSTMILVRRRRKCNDTQNFGVFQHHFSALVHSQKCMGVTRVVDLFRHKKATAGYFKK